MNILIALRSGLVRNKVLIPWLALPLMGICIAYWYCETYQSCSSTSALCSFPCQVVKKTQEDAVAFFTLVLCYVVWLQFLWMTRQEDVLRRSVDAANKAADAAKLQATAAIKSQLPIVGWAGQKLIGYTSMDGDPAHAVNPWTEKLPANICRPEFAIHNSGPSRIVASAFAIKCEVTKEPAPIPHYGGMGRTAVIIEPGQPLWFAMPQNLIVITAEQMASISAGTSHLWFYGFLKYLDFLDEWHEIGFCFKWSVEPALGFVREGSSDYNYIKNQKYYE